MVRAALTPGVLLRSARIQIDAMRALMGQGQGRADLDAGGRLADHAHRGGRDGGGAIATFWRPFLFFCIHRPTAQSQ